MSEWDEELDIEVNIGFRAKTPKQAKEVWESIQDALDWTDGVCPYACEGTIINRIPSELPHDLEAFFEKLPEYASETAERAFDEAVNE